jgi:hypothetical protein
MNKRYDVCAPRWNAKTEKTYWHRVGTGFENEKGVGIVFDSLPLPDKEGKVTVRLFEPREKQDTIPIAQTDGTRVMPRQSVGADLDDQIPFLMEWR